MSITQAAKLARIVLPGAVAELKFYSGSDDSGSNDYGEEADESDEIGGSVAGKLSTKPAPPLLFLLY